MLPDDVFVDGEKKPIKKKSKKAKDATPVAEAQPAHKKRNVANAGLDVSDERAQILTNAGVLRPATLLRGLLTQLFVVAGEPGPS